MLFDQPTLRPLPLIEVQKLKYSVIGCQNRVRLELDQYRNTMCKLQVSTVSLADMPAQVMM